MASNERVVSVSTIPSAHIFKPSGLPFLPMVSGKKIGCSFKANIAKLYRTIKIQYFYQEEMTVIQHLDEYTIQTTRCQAHSKRIALQH